MALTERERTERTAFTGVITCGLGLVLIIISVIFSNSLVQMADLFNSVLEFISISLSWLTLRALRKDNRAVFNYGLGKIENISSLFIGAFMLVSILIMAILIGYRLLHLVRIQGFGVWLGIACTLIFGTLNAILWVKSLRHKRAAPSPIVDAQCRLFAVKTVGNTCMFFTFVLSLSLDYHWVLYLDPLASCITVGFMSQSAWKLIRHSIHDLLDRSLDEPLQALINKQLFRFFDEYTSLDSVRSRYSGQNVFIEIFLGFDSQRPLAEVQKITDTIKHNLEADIPHAEVLVIPRAQ
ncbi:MAG: cation transporter [Kiritimatiellae bacterium]|nr:cation transporter [Kiritimatiellia bacterium]